MCRGNCCIIAGSVCNWLISHQVRNYIIHYVCATIEFSVHEGVRHPVRTGRKISDDEVKVTCIARCEEFCDSWWDAGVTALNSQLQSINEHVGEIQQYWLDERKMSIF
jgi:hypothetical protein